MAYTKAPVTDTHNTVRVPSLGSSFLTSGTTSFPPTLNYYNCFPLKEKQHGHDPKYRVSKREPYKVAHTVTTNNSTVHLGPVIVSTTNAGDAYFGKGDKIYKVAYNNGSPILSTITTDADAGVYSGTEALEADGSNCFVFLVNGGKIIKWNEAGTVTTTTPSVGLSALSGLVFLNGYLFAIAANGFIYNSDPGNALLTWNTTNFINAEIFPDTAIAIAKHKNHLVVFGRQSIEFFYDAAIEIGSPLTRQQEYTSQVGLVQGAFSFQTCIAEIGDDLYFIGREKNASRALYRIRNFKVEQIDSQYIAAILNDNSTSTATYGVETVYVNNNPMVQLKFQDLTPTPNVPVYYPETDTWCIFTTYDIGSLDNKIGTMFTNPRWSSDGYMQTSAGFYFYRNDSTPTTVEIRTSDHAWTTSLTAYYTSEIIDFGTNFWKHIARVDGIGDYGVNTLTLKYYPSSAYTNIVTCSPTQTPSTFGDFNNISWYNLGRFRRFALELEMAGAGPAFHEAFDITYNVGAA